MEFNGVLLMAVLWFLLSLIGSGRRKSQKLPPASLPQRRPPVPIPGGPDATQQEGSRLEQMLRELQRSLEEAAEPHRPAERTLPLPQEPDERASLEEEPQVISLEREVHREARLLVDRDDEAGEIEGRRIQAAATRDHAQPRGRAPQVTSDQPVRQEAADHTAATPYSARQLRDAVIWREILGPPVGLRDGDPEGRRSL